MKLMRRQIPHEDSDSIATIQSTDTKKQSSEQSWLIWTSLALVAVAAALVGMLFRRRKRQQPKLPEAYQLFPALEQFEGLTEAEALARRTIGPDQIRQEEAQQVRRNIWRRNITSIFNISMLGLALVQWLLGDFLGGLLTLGVLAMSLGLNIFQESFAAKRVGELKEMARPQATIIRESQVRSIDAVEVVEGDILVVGPGDRFFADGEVLSSTDILIEDTELPGANQTKYKHDRVNTGSTCVQGRAAYQVTALPKYIEPKTSNHVFKNADALTPLQTIIDRILRVMLLFIGLFLLLLILDIANVKLLLPRTEELYRESASIIFSLAPSGLFFMIVVTYAMGSAALAQTGALVRDSLVVESLAQVTTLCFGKTDALTGAEVQIEMIPAPADVPSLAESRIRRILGDLAHSLPPNNRYIRTLAETLDGEKRILQQTTRLLSIYGWAAVTLAEVDARGTYVIGEPEILRPFLISAGGVEAGENEPRESRWQAGLKNIGQFFGRGKQEIKPDEDENKSPVETSSEPVTEGAEPQGFFARLRTRFADMTGSAETKDNDDTQTQEPSLREVKLAFAYLPEPCSLFDEKGQPALPQGLIPLCNLIFSEQISPEAMETVTTFATEGVKIKILSSGKSERVLAIAEQLGLDNDEDAPLAVISGAELTQMSHLQLTELVRETTLFASLTREQKGQIVNLLREQREHVAMVGDSIGDIPAMEAAHLSITTRSSTQAALSRADIVLLKSSLDVLPTVVQQGQKIVNGLLDILKLNLTQIGYLLLLIVAMVLSGHRVFYYHPTQGGVIVFFTLILPAIGLTFWATAGAVPRQRMNLQLIRFVIPASLTIAVAILLLSSLFGQSTQSITYTQLAVTFGLITMGSLLVIFVQPPAKIFTGGDDLSGDWRPTALAIASFVLFNVIVFVPLAQEFLRIAPLMGALDYIVISVVAVLWGSVLLAIWRSHWFNKGMVFLTDRLTSSKGQS